MPSSKLEQMPDEKLYDYIHQWFETISELHYATGGIFQREFS